MTVMIVSEFTRNRFFSSGDYQRSALEVVQKRSFATDIPAISESKDNALLREQLRIQQLREFLKQLAQRGEVESFTASIAWKTWQELAKLISNRLPVPNTGAGPDGQIIFSWNKDQHHFEVEIFPSGLGEFFYLDFNTNATWDTEYHLGEKVPEGVYEKLHIFSL